MPFQVDGVAVDFISPDKSEPFLEAVLSATAGSVIEAPPLIYMKLKAGRLKDRADVVELIKSSIDVDACRVYLVVNAPALAAAFDEAVRLAAAEED